MLHYPNVASLPSNPDEFELDFGLSRLSRRRIHRNTSETDRNALPSREKLGVCAGRNDAAFAKCREIIVCAAQSTLASLSLFISLVLNWGKII
ncbi:hypothetical protein ACFX13_012077 [Malus domestica]